MHKIEYFYRTAFVDTVSCFVYLQMFVLTYPLFSSITEECRTRAVTDTVSEVSEHSYRDRCVRDSGYLETWACALIG